MAKKKKHIATTEDFLRYQHGQMTAKEQHIFEKKMLDDDFAGEAMEGLSQLSNEEISADLSSMHHRLKARTAKGKLWNYWRVAAAMLILATFSFMLIYFIDTNTTQEIAQTKEMPSEVKTNTDKVEELVFSDSSKDDTDEVIAYQQKAVEPEKERPLPAAQTKANEPPPEIEEEVIVDSEVMAEEAELALETFDIEVDDEVQVIAEAEPSPEIAETNKELSYQAFEAPAPASMKKELSDKPSSRAIAKVNTRTVTGIITSSEDGEVVPGVNVVVKGTSIGTASDMDGKFLVEVPSDMNAIFVISYIGFETTEIEVKDRHEINVEIDPDGRSLNETIVSSLDRLTDYKNQEYISTPPKPAVGDSEYKLYIKENLRYPESGLADKTKGLVILKFSVGIDGQILNMEVQKSLGEEFDKEAKRLIQEGPDWEPAIENDSTVVREVKLKIRFRPEK